MDLYVVCVAYVQFGCRHRFDIRFVYLFPLHQTTVYSTTFAATLLASLFSCWFEINLHSQYELWPNDLCMPTIKQLKKANAIRCGLTCNFFFGTPISKNEDEISVG